MKQAQLHEVGLLIHTWDFFYVTLIVMLKVLSKEVVINHTIFFYRSAASLLFTFDFLHSSSPGFIVGLQSSGPLKLCSANLSLQ